MCYTIVRNKIKQAKSLKENDLMTNLVEVNNEQVVTTSLVVAETFGKRHDNVLQAIKNLEKDVLSFKEMFSEGETPDKYGRPRKTYFMNKDGFTLLAMGFNGKEALQFKLQYIEAFNKMEEYIKNGEVKVFSYMIDDPAKRARLWADEMDEVYAIIHEKEEENQQLTQVVEEAKPKVQAFEQAMEIEKLHSMKEVANLMGVGRNTLFAQLREAKILNESNLPYQRYINSGYFQMKHVVKNKYYSCNVVLVTQKGMGWLVMNKDKIMNKK